MEAGEWVADGHVAGAGDGGDGPDAGVVGRHHDGVEVEKGVAPQEQQLPLQFLPATNPLPCRFRLRMRERGRRWAGRRKRCWG